MTDNLVIEAALTDDEKVSTKIINTVEFLLLTGGRPLDKRTLVNAVGDGVGQREITAAIEQLRQTWSQRSLALIETAGGFQFVSRSPYFDSWRRFCRDRPPRLSRSLVEVLAIIAYYQPATRGDIEQLRGIAVASTQLAFLEEQGWIEVIGRRESPGRPMLYATTKTFLDDLALTSLDELPPLADFDQMATDSEGEGFDDKRESDEQAIKDDAVNDTDSAVSH